MKTSLSRKAFLAIDYTILILASLSCMLPFINLLAISFSSNLAVMAGRVRFWPVDFTTASYQFVGNSSAFLNSLAVSVRRVLLGVSINLVLLVITAYPLSRSPRQFAGRNLYMWYFLITMLIGGGLIPTYLVMVKLGLLDTIWALVLPGALPVYSMILLTNFMRGLPRELEEAAFIDGAGPMRVLLQVILPISKPGVATVALFCIVHHWNAWFDGVIYMNNTANYPLQSYLRSLLNDMERMLRNVDEYYEQLAMLISARTGRAAMLFLAALPMMVTYPFLQKYFTKGLVLGSVKG